LNITTLKAFRNLVYLNNLQPFGLKSVVNWMMSSKSAIEKVIKEDEVMEIFLQPRNLLDFCRVLLK
jgi:hypothetical protein